MLFVVAIEGKKFEFKTFAEAKFIYGLCRSQGYHEAVLKMYDVDGVEFHYSPTAAAFFQVPTKIKENFYKTP